MISEILTPLKDELYQSPWNIRFTVFRLGPMNVIFVLKDYNALPPELANAFSVFTNFKTDLPFVFKRYICFCIVNEDQPYILNQFDKKEDAWIWMNDTINNLKSGNRIDIVDKAGSFESIRISYMGIDWIWA